MMWLLMGLGCGVLPVDSESVVPTAESKEAPVFAMPPPDASRASVKRSPEPAVQWPVVSVPTVPDRPGFSLEGATRFNPDAKLGTTEPSTLNLAERWKIVDREFTPQERRAYLRRLRDAGEGPR